MTSIDKPVSVPGAVRVASAAMPERLSCKSCKIMNRLAILVVVTAASLCLGAAVPAGNAVMNQNALREQLIGTWTAVSVDNVLPDGSRMQSYGPNPSGILMVDRNGRFSLVLMRSDLPEFASSMRDSGTAEENKAIVLGSLSVYGKYSFGEEDRSLILSVEKSSFPNWNGTQQKRTIDSISRDELKWYNAAASVGGTAELTWKRMK